MSSNSNTTQILQNIQYFINELLHRASSDDSWSDSDVERALRWSAYCESIARTAESRPHIAVPLVRFVSFLVSAGDDQAIPQHKCLLLLRNGRLNLLRRLLDNIRLSHSAAVTAVGNLRQQRPLVDYQSTMERLLNERRALVICCRVGRGRYSYRLHMRALAMYFHLTSKTSALNATKNMTTDGNNSAEALPGSSKWLQAKFHQLMSSKDGRLLVVLALSVPGARHMKGVYDIALSVVCDWLAQPPLSSLSQFLTDSVIVDTLPELCESSPLRLAVCDAVSRVVKSQDDNVELARFLPLVKRLCSSVDAEQTLRLLVASADVSTSAGLRWRLLLTRTVPLCHPKKRRRRQMLLF